MKRLLAFRDLFWLALIIVLVVGWWLDHRRPMPSAAPVDANLILVNDAGQAVRQDQSHNPFVVSADEHGIIPWTDAKRLIASGKVKSVMQAHSLEVGIFLKDGGIYRTKEEHGDQVLHFMRECGQETNIEFATE